MIRITEGGNEQHLAKLLQSFNKMMYINYAQKTGKIITTCNQDLDLSTVHAIKTPDGVGDFAFRISFNYPVYISLSHPICRFRSHRNYPVRERYFIANLGLVPVFFSSLNIMTVLKLWGDRADTFFNPVNSPLSDTEINCWELAESSKSAEYSSMNFILQNQVEPEEAGKRITDIFEKYFRLGYWAFPKKGFSPSTHFLHGREKLSSQVKISKSLYVVADIGKLQRFQVEGNTIEAIEVTLGGLAENNGDYFFARFPAYIDMEIAEKMIDRGNLGSSFINGVVAEITVQAGHKISLMTTIADYGESYFDILSALVGIVSDKKYSSNDAVSSVGTIDEIRESVFNLYLDLYRKLQVPRTLSEMVPNSFDIALKSMFPILITEGQEVMMIHPLVWGFLKKWNLIRDDDNEQKDILVNLLKVMDLSKNKSGFSKTFLDDSAEYFSKRGLNKYNFVRSAFNLAKDIRFAKVMRKTLEIQETPSY